MKQNHHSKLKKRERDVLSECKALLDVYKNMGLLDYHRISTTGIPKIGGGFRPNPMKGFSDTIIWILNGPDLYVEIKRPGEKPSEAQLIFKSRAEKMGRVYVVVRSSVELSDLLNDVLRKKNTIA